MAKYIELTPTGLAEKSGTATSAGVADAGKLPQLDANGRLDTSLLPTGIGADTSTLTATEALSAGNFVNVYDNAGAFAVRKADASTSGKEAHGFVLAAVAASGTATVYHEGRNNMVTGQTPGRVYLSTTPGAAAAAGATAAGQVFQSIGVAVSATEINFERGEPVLRA